MVPPPDQPMPTWNQPQAYANAPEEQVEAMNSWQRRMGYPGCYEWVMPAVWTVTQTISHIAGRPPAPPIPQRGQVRPPAPPIPQLQGQVRPPAPPVPQGFAAVVAGAPVAPLPQGMEVPYGAGPAPSTSSAQPDADA